MVRLRDLPRAVEPACCTATSLSSFRFVWIQSLVVCICGTLTILCPWNCPCPWCISRLWLFWSWHYAVREYVLVGWKPDKEGTDSVNSQPHCLVNTVCTGAICELVWFWITQNDSRILLHIWTSWEITPGISLLCGETQSFWKWTKEQVVFGLTPFLLYTDFDRKWTMWKFFMFPEQRKINCQR